MVKVGDFKVELVAADTKEAFKEHTAPDGQVYAEVEPDMDYFVSLGTDVGGVMMQMSVDGVFLGYNCLFECSKLNLHAKSKLLFNPNKIIINLCCPLYKIEI